MTTVDELRAYVRAATSDDAFLASCLTQASELVNQRVKTANVPGPILDLATREVAADLFNRRGVRNGIANFDGPDLTPVRVTRDPMRAADDILRPWTGAGIA